MARKEFNKEIENTILELKLSVGNPIMNIYEQEKFMVEELDKLHKEIHQTRGSERTRAVSSYIHICELYWNLLYTYIKANKDVKNPKLKTEDRNKAHNFIHTFIFPTTDRFKSIYHDDNSESKIEIGKSLLKLYQLYLECARYLWQKPSSEYISIYTQVLKDIEEMKITS